MVDVPAVDQRHYLRATNPHRNAVKVVLVGEVAWDRNSHLGRVRGFDTVDDGVAVQFIQAGSLTLCLDQLECVVIPHVAGTNSPADRARFNFGVEIK